MGGACTKSDRGGTGDDIEPGHRSEASSVISAIPPAHGEKVNNSTPQTSRYTSIESQPLSHTSESTLNLVGEKITVDDF